MGRFRKLDEQEERFFKSARDKHDALHLMNKRREQMGIGDDRVPYYLVGRKSKTKQSPIYNNGRLMTNQWGQKRVYLDWDIAERTNALLGFNEWREE